jgi:hypothetical protein
MAPAEPDGTTWLIGTVEWGEEIAVLRVRDKCDDLFQGLPYRLRVTARIHTTRDDGRPDPEEGRRLRKLEDALEASIDGRAVLVALVTIPKQKHFFFYADSSSWMREWGLAQRAASPDRELDLRLDNDPELRFYTAVRRDARVGNADRVVMDKLVEQGADLRRPRNLEFFLCFPTREGADEVAQYLLDHDFTTVVRPAPTDGEWSLIVSCHDAALPEFIARTSSVFQSRAEALGVATTAG